MWFFTADLHLGHNNIIKYCNRPFMNSDENQFYDLVRYGNVPVNEFKISVESTNKMDETILQSINDVVGLNDNLVIIGDFCFSNVKDRRKRAESYRERINCKNVYLLYGNHDDKENLKGLFKITADSYTFHVDGQNIFCCHYPCRSWNKKFYGSWMLYGHVHGNFTKNDHGQFEKHQEAMVEEKLGGLKTQHNFSDEQITSIKNAFADLFENWSGSNFTLDVGVDNRYKRNHVSFGTPWSMDEIRAVMEQRKAKFDKMKDLCNE